MMALPGEFWNLFWVLGVPLAGMVELIGKSKPIDPALCDAASSGDLRRVRQLLDAGIDENSADEDGTTALMAAAFSGEREIVRFLLERGADPNLQDDSGLTALMNAVIGNGEMNLEGAHLLFQDIVLILLEADSDPSLEDENELTAAAYAASYELDEICRLLEE